MPIPGLANLALLLGLAFFFGLAFEEFYARSGEKRPGGIRTFPLLAITGGVLYLLDAERLLPLTAGLLVLGAWLVAYYRDAMREHDATGAPNVGLVVPACNLLAYLIGPLALAGPHWLAIGVTVAAVLFITGRERLHSIAERVDLAEIVTAGQFLILTGLILPLLPDEPVTTLTTITPYKVWLAVLAVCTISYASYLIRRYVAPEGGDVWIAALGGLYSSTATTVVLARRAGQEKDFLPRARAGIVLATSLMYPRLLVVIAVFNRPLAQALLPALIGLAALGLVIAFLLYRRAGPAPRIDASARTAPRNPLELSVAALFAMLFVAISIAASWVQAHFGVTGVEVLAAIVGVTDIDPFVLSLAQSVAAPLTLGAAAAAVLIASASNNLLKAWYCGAFAGFRASFPASASLVLLAAAAAAAAFGTALERG